MTEQCNLCREAASPKEAELCGSCQHLMDAAVVTKQCCQKWRIGFKVELPGCSKLSLKDMTTTLANIPFLVMPLIECTDYQGIYL